MNTKPLTQESFKSASKDIQSELNKKRKETPKNHWIDWSFSYKYGCRNCVDTWVVGMSRLNTSEVRKLNNELGLNTNEGLSKWYK